MSWSHPALLLAALGVVAVLGAVLWTRRRMVVVDVDGRSMEPTYRTGDLVLVRRAGLAELKVGDIVVVERPRGYGQWRRPATRRVRGRSWMIKRVAALPGDRVPVGVPVDAVPAGHLVVLGDNPDASIDSRSVGPFPAERMLGVVVRRLRARE